MAYLPNVRYATAVPDVSILFFPVRLFQSRVGGLGGCGTGIGGHNGLVFFDGEVTLPQHVIHLARRKVCLLQYFRIGLCRLIHLLIGRDCAGVIFLAAKQIAQAERRDFIVQAVIESFPASLPDSSIYRRSVLIITGCPQQVSFFERHKHVVRVALDEATSNRESLLITMFATQEQNQQKLCIGAGLATSLGALTKILKSLLLVSTNSQYRDARSQCQGQTAHDVIVRSDNQLRRHVPRRKFEHSFMIAPGSYRI